MMSRTTRVALLLSCVTLGCRAFVATDPSPARIEPSPAAPPDLRLLQEEAARAAIVDETVEPYHSVLAPLEIAAMTGKPLPDLPIIPLRQWARQQYQAAVLPFSAGEQRVLRVRVDEAAAVLAQHTSMPTDLPWTIIKISTQLCGGSAHTRGDAIILSERHLERMLDDSTDEAKQASHRQALTLLIHERMHIWQRLSPERWAALYREWGFVSAVSIESCSWLDRVQLTNPDAPQPTWVFELENEDGSSRYIWPRAILDPDLADDAIPTVPQSFRAISIDVVQRGPLEFELVLNEQGVPRHRTLEDEKGYADRLPPGMAWDHPHEIAAYAIADMLVAEHFGDAQPSDPRTLAERNRLRNWLDGTLPALASVASAQSR